MLGLTKPLTAGFGLLLGMLAHHVGWPLVEGGSQRLADAMVSALEEQGGVVVTGHEVTDLREFEGVPAVVLDRYRHAPGVFTMDWVLSEPVPWRDAELRRSPTVHVGGGLEEMVAAEAAAAAGRIADRPVVLTVQPTVVDSTRAPRGGHVLWGCTHVPYGCDVDMTQQIERFAPGFRDIVVQRVTTTPPQLAAGNPNDVGGDISNGLPSRWQMLARPGAPVEHRQDPGTWDVPGVCGHPARAGGARHVRGQRRPRGVARGLRHPGRSSPAASMTAPGSDRWPPCGMPAARLGSRPLTGRDTSADGSSSVSTVERVGHDVHPGADSAQAAVTQLRHGLLDGRGPGASRSEFLEHTRARPAVGGVPVSALRERVTLDAAAARGNADVLALAARAQRARVGADLDVLLPRLRPRALRNGAEGRLRRPAARRGLRMVAALFAVLLVVRRLGRHRRLHRDSR